ncbi:MAG: Ni/Fe-hydrogenase cytochrome b subunit [Syntrophobacteraceae bacterium]|nr:Ni/Fe-hydrogenase cytochrome b subunit [Syntrophobacteraceae bacterium]
MKKLVHLLIGDPKKVFTPFNVITGFIMVVGLALIGLRLVKGLGAVTNLTQTTPWGLWIGFDVMSGVALAAGGYTLAATVHLFGLKQYEPLVRPAILTGFLGYVFVVLGLILDLGRPWRMPFIMIFPRGVTSVLFEVGMCVAAYLTVQLLEFVPAFWEWLQWDGLRRIWGKLTVWLSILGVVLSTLHQSSLGSLFLLAPTKLYPLWYSPYLPLFFFVSSIIAGLSMVIVESSLSHRLFAYRLSPTAHFDLDTLTLGLAKAAAVVLYVYFFLKLIGLSELGRWDLLNAPYGYVYLVEMLGFVALPCILYTIGVRTGNVKLVRFTGGWTVIGIIFNRLNVSIIAFNWQLSPHYYPSWMEITVSVTLVTMGIWLFRWLVNRLPVMSDEKPETGTNTLKDLWATGAEGA